MFLHGSQAQRRTYGELEDGIDDYTNKNAGSSQLPALLPAKMKLNLKRGDNRKGLFSFSLSNSKVGDSPPGVEQRLSKTGVNMEISHAFFANLQMPQLWNPV